MLEVLLKFLNPLLPSPGTQQVLKWYPIPDEITHSSSDSSYDDAEQYITAREYEKAVNCLTKAINLQPKAVLYYVERAEILCPISDETSHSPSGSSYDDAEQHITAREYEKAVNCLTKAINLQPKAVLYYVERAEILLMIISHSLSDSSYDDAEQYIVAREYEKSVNCLTKAINLQPKAVLYYVERAEIFLRLCDFSSAILNYKRACVLEPDNYDFYSRLAFLYYFYGQCLFDQNLFPEALESFSRAAEMRPEVAGYHMRRWAWILTNCNETQLTLV